MRTEWRGIIQKNDDGSENINYNDENFPSYIHKGWICPDVTWSNVAHFHQDIEFVCVISGHMGYNINGRNIYLREGDAIMVNSNQIHFSFATRKERCEYIILILHPRILCSTYHVENKYVAPVTENERLSYIHFTRDMSCCKNIQMLAEKMLKVMDNSFLITKQFYEIWEVIINYCKESVNFDDLSECDPALGCVKRMLNYSRVNYAKAISLEDIANAGGVSKTYCNQLFHKYINRSPVENLMRFRAEKVAELLTDTHLSMSEIAARTGFSGASYMTEIFKRYYKKTPREFRKNRI